MWRPMGENFRRWSELCRVKPAVKEPTIQPHRSNLKRPPLIMTNDPICFGLSFFLGAAPILPRENPIHEANFFRAPSNHIRYVPHVGSLILRISKLKILSPL